MILELAVSSKSEYVITFNKRDFVGIESFGIQVLRLSEFLNLIGE